MIWNPKDDAPLSTANHCMRGIKPINFQNPIKPMSTDD